MISSQMKIWGAVLTIAALVGGGLYITRWKSEGASVINLGLEDNGKTINVSVGDKIIVKLGESGSTGYIWEYTVDENFTKVIKNERIH